MQTIPRNALKSSIYTVLVRICHMDALAARDASKYVLTKHIDSIIHWLYYLPNH